MSFRRRIHDILEGGERGGPTGTIFEGFITSLIAANAVALTLETVESLHAAAPRFFQAFEVVSVAIFTVEYTLRVWSAPEDPRYAGAVAGRVRFVLSPLALIDLAAIGPFYLPFLGIDLRFVRLVRMLRIFRLAKLGRYADSLRTFGLVVRSRKEGLLVTLSMLAVTLFIASTLMYYAENEAQPDKFSSVPASLWWGIATLTTIGYGDIYPVTPFGKLLAGFIAVVGICVVALPTGLFASAFIEEMQKKKKEGPGPEPGAAAGASAPRTCPHCGKEI